MPGFSLQDFRNAAVIAYGLNCIDDFDFACLYDYCHSRPLFPYWKFEEFDLASWDEEECVTELRFAMKDLQLPMHYLEFPDIVCSQGTLCCGIEGYGPPLSNFFGFFDGTVCHISRPKYLKREMYNGHKRIHAMKFQSVVQPNGIIANLACPYEGRRHDRTILQQSGLSRVGHFKRQPL